MKYLCLFLLACGSSTPVAQKPADPPQHQHAHHEHHGGHHRFEKADDWAPMFDDPARDEWQKPDAVVAALAITPGMTVADVGAGTGYFSARLAKAVGATGTVLAVDVEPDMVRYLGERAQKENTPQVKAQLGAADDPKLPANGVDRVLIVDVWHHLGARTDYAKKLAAALKPNGFVLVVDFNLDSDRGPPKEMKLAPAAIKADLESAGLVVETVNAGLPDQYVLKGVRRP